MRNNETEYCKYIRAVYHTEKRIVFDRGFEVFVCAQKIFISFQSIDFFGRRFLQENKLKIKCMTRYMYCTNLLSYPINEAYPLIRIQA